MATSSAAILAELRPALADLAADLLERARDPHVGRALQATWRREREETGGPGTFRGGVGIEYVIAPHRNPVPLTLQIAPQSQCAIFAPGGVCKSDILDIEPAVLFVEPSSLREFANATSRVVDRRPG